MMKKMKGRKFGGEGDSAAMLDHFDKTIVINLVINLNHVLPYKSFFYIFVGFLTFLRNIKMRTMV